MIGFEQRRTAVGALLAALCFAPLAAAQADMSDQARTDVNIEEIVVTSRRQGEPLSQHAGNLAHLDAEAIAAIGHQHINELMTHIAGVWLSRGSGQEHLTAIRSPVLTGAGSCGDFLFLEDGIPIRPSGFCNVNQMFEIHTEQAVSMEVIRGPGNALYGSNAVHGIINVLTPATSEPLDSLLAIEVGSNDYLRIRALLPGGPDTPLLGSLVYADDGGFRDDSGYRQGKLQLAVDWDLPNSELTTVFSATDLDQETAGFIVGEDAYKDPAVNRGNVNPEAFRDASSQRLYAIYKRSAARFDFDIRPYVRHSDMRFLQHFLPGQPLEENGHVSAGAISALSFGSDRRAFIAGIDIEWADMFLEETQVGPTEGSEFLQETRPEGKHYDFDVRSVAIAPYLQAHVDIGDRVTFGSGLRVEYTRYDYENRMLTGNTRDDGTACGFGGCLYSRPASRSDTFTNVAPKFSFNYQLRDDASLFGVLARGFRAPQVTELYRLQSGQAVADLDSETIDSIELGLRWGATRWRGDVAVFAMQKRDSVFRDSDGFNVSGGRSRHRGIEVAVSLPLSDALLLDVDSSYARHSYDFDRIAARGEIFVSGNDVDSAPRWLGSAELRYEPGTNAAYALQWTSIGEYFLDAENRFQYPGHDVLNLRARIDLSDRLSVTARLNNVLDEAVADRADYAFGNFRYFPGRGRELFIELSYAPLLARGGR